MSKMIEVEYFDFVVEIEINRDVNDVFDIIEKVKPKFKGLKNISLDLLCLLHPHGKILDNSLPIEELLIIYKKTDGILKIVDISKKTYSIWDPVKVYYLKDKIDSTLSLKKRITKKNKIEI